MKQRGKPFEEIYDLLAVRVLVNTIPECYHVLGIIHHKWTPLQERIKDYIASPKSNGYQSLHTTVFGPGGQLYEIQIRTRDMHHTAEYGIAAHWLFKEGKRSADELDRHLAWFRQLIELQQDTHTPEEFLEFLKVRSEEHTSELQSRLHLVCRLLLEKKKRNHMAPRSQVELSDTPRTTPRSPCGAHTA